MRRADHLQTVGQQRRKIWAAVLLGEDEPLLHRPVDAAVLRGPAGRDPPLAMQDLLPRHRLVEGAKTLVVVRPASRIASSVRCRGSRRPPRGRRRVAALLEHIELLTWHRILGQAHAYRLGGVDHAGREQAAGVAGSCLRRGCGRTSRGCRRSGVAMAIYRSDDRHRQSLEDPQGLAMPATAAAPLNRSRCRTGS